MILINPGGQLPDVSFLTSQAAAQVAVQVLMTLAAGLLSAPRGPGTIAAGAKTVVRNMPLVILLALLAFLFWPSESDTDADGPDVGLRKPNGMPVSEA